MSWRVAGAYFESCNCDAICPCRMVGGVPGGRSTHGVCLGALSWRIDDGHFDGLDLAGLAIVFVTRYDDDEPGSPWSLVLHLDERADASRRDALERIFTGAAGGEHILKLPWVRKPSELIDVRVDRIELVDGQGGWHLRVGTAVALDATREVEQDVAVRCGIPGYDQPGVELYADAFAVDDEPFAWELAGNCAFGGTFDYESD